MPQADAERRRAAFAALALQHEGDLLRAARRLCRGDADRAADLAQDALVRAYEAYRDGRFTEGSNPRPWLLRILTNLFINDYHRRRRWESGLDVDTLTSGGEAGPAQTHAPPSEIPGVALLEGVLDEELEAALAMLPAPLRACVVLVDVEGLEYAEAAAALGVPIGTVRSRLARARMRLEDLLADWARHKRIRP
ncbi:MAG: sigma-70 family RNA polymerase sigma factor [Armatimonadetes bacterium]|nr:sigma-70 family RNA polymerase sigma factor [Armatimonadota bacterium]